MSLGLIPLRNWGHVDGLVYRSAQPMEPYEYEWLSKVAGIGEIVNLRAELDHDKKFFSFVYDIPVVDHQPPKLQQATDFMDLVRDNSRLGIKTLIHCEHGYGRTSTFSVLAKLALGYTMDEAIEDEHKRFHYSFKHKEQEQWLRDNEKYLLKY